jgi:lysophospholipid acyltransferase (LPLAT)-like uncharacterized protein
MTFLQKTKYFFIRKFSKFLIYSIIKTCRIKIIGQEKIQEIKNRKKPLIHTFWHRHIFFTIYQFKKTGARPLISQSRDGELVSQVAIEFGMNPIRGSSSKGGARAFLSLLHSIQNEKKDILITADGPKGPPREIKDGTILLAQKTNSIIIPICWASSRRKIFKKTWDQFMIPLPFSRITFAFGKPFTIGPEYDCKSDSTRQELKNRLKQEMDHLENDLEKIHGTT